MNNDNNPPPGKRQQKPSTGNPMDEETEDHTNQMKDRHPLKRAKPEPKVSSSSSETPEKPKQKRIQQNPADQDSLRRALTNGTFLEEFTPLLSDLRFDTTFNQLSTSLILRNEEKKHDPKINDLFKAALSTQQLTVDFLDISQYKAKPLESII